MTKLKFKVNWAIQSALINSRNIYIYMQSKSNYTKQSEQSTQEDLQHLKLN